MAGWYWVHRAWQIVCGLVNYRTSVVVPKIRSWVVEMQEHWPTVVFQTSSGLVQLGDLLLHVIQVITLYIVNISCQCSFLTWCKPLIIPCQLYFIYQTTSGRKCALPVALCEYFLCNKIGQCCIYNVVHALHSTCVIIYATPSTRLKPNRNLNPTLSLTLYFPTALQKL